VDVGEGHLDCVRLLIAYQAFDPGVDDFDLEFVAAGLEGFTDVDAIGCMPDSAERSSLDGDFGEVPDVAEIEVDGLGVGPRRRGSGGM